MVKFVQAAAPTPKKLWLLFRCFRCISRSDYSSQFMSIDPLSHSANHDILAQYLFESLAGVHKKRETVVGEHIGRDLFEDTADSEETKQMR
jgi:hypothetical protein